MKYLLIVALFLTACADDQKPQLIEAIKLNTDTVGMLNVQHGQLIDAHADRLEVQKIELKRVQYLDRIDSLKLELSKLD